MAPGDRSIIYMWMGPSSPLPFCVKYDLNCMYTQKQDTENRLNYISIKHLYLLYIRI